MSPTFHEIRTTSGPTFTIDRFTLGYIEAALFTTFDESTPAGGEPLDQNYGPADLAPETLRSMIADCQKFQDANRADLDHARSSEYNGHDFWLTRNEHGTGFWDRDLGEVGDRLTAAAHTFGGVWLYVHEGRIYQS
jgi:hypothetical protein